MQIEKIARANDKSVKFLLDFFEKEGQPLKWDKKFVVYFAGFDSKRFYTHHRGFGLAADALIASVYLGGGDDYRLAVHENTHAISYMNWPRTTSFLSEGLAKYTEALATDENKNHSSTVEFLKQGKLFPLKALVNHKIGQTGMKTTVGYPASGSFVGFIIETYGLESFKKVHIFEGERKEAEDIDNSWKNAYSQPLSDLEKEWLLWLAKRYEIDKNLILDHLKNQ